MNRRNRRVAIIGAGMTRFGQHYEKSLSDLAVEAGVKALDNAGISSEEVQALYLGTMSSGLFTGQEHLASLIADQTAMTLKPSIRVEAACASGGVALRQGYLEILSGKSDVVVVGGVEKMTDLSVTATTKILSTAASYEWEIIQGATFPALNALLARLHMHRFGTTEEQLARIAVKNHANALHNPYAHLKKKITVQDVLSSPFIAEPIKLLECAPISDGAAAIVLCSEELVRRNHFDTPVWIRGSGHAVDTLSLHSRNDLLTLQATVQAAKQAYQQAGIRPESIEMAEVHDAFTIMELLAIEDLGFVEKGKGGPFIEAGHTHIGGKIPVNPSGGLKARGHPAGASGVAQAVEALMQLRGEAQGRNTNATTALLQSVGGTGGTATVHILARER